jgi:hypothetical protein
MTTIRKTRKHQKDRLCPKCRSDKVIPIVYGLIDSPDAIQKIKNGEFDSGGCCVYEDSPKWKCRDCEESFGKIGLL